MCVQYAVSIYCTCTYMSHTLCVCRKTNYGTRIDYILCSCGMERYLTAAEVWAHRHGSDHCPVMADFSLSLSPATKPPSLSSSSSSYLGKQTKLSTFLTSEPGGQSLQRSTENLTSEQKGQSLQRSTENPTFKQRGQSLQRSRGGYALRGRRGKGMKRQWTGDKSPSDKTKKMAKKMTLHSFFGGHGGGMGVLSDPVASRGMGGVSECEGDHLCEGDRDGVSPDANPSVVQVSPDTNSSVVQVSPDANPLVVQVSPDTNPSVIQVSPDTNSSVIQVPPDANPSVLQVSPDANPSVVQVSPDTNSSVIQVPPDTNPSVIQVSPDIDSSVIQVSPDANQSLIQVSSSHQLSQEWRSVLPGPPQPPLCPGHGEPAVLRRVKKVGPNRHRQFWVCGRPGGRKGDPKTRCDFFQWAVKPH